MAKLGLLARHKSVGITILALALLRLLWRATQPRAGAAHRHGARATLAGAGHAPAALGLLLAMPLSGWLMSSAKNYPVSWFGLLQLPDLVAPGEAMYAAMHEAHEIMAVVLAVDRAAAPARRAEASFRRSRRRAAANAAVRARRRCPRSPCCAGVLLAGGPGVASAAGRGAPRRRPLPRPRPPRVRQRRRQRHAARSVRPPRATAVRYVLDSRAQHAGVPLPPGRRHRDRALHAVPRDARLAGGRRPARNLPGNPPGAATIDAALEVAIDVASLDTADADRDGTLRGADLFAVARFPQARFVAQQFAAGAAPPPPPARRCSPGQPADPRHARAASPCR